MSVNAILVCDGCGWRGESELLHMRSIRRMRAVARKGGWRSRREHGRTFDYCGGCAEQGLHR